MISRRSLLLAGVALPTAAYGQCVTDTPAVDACRGGVRITAPPGVTLDLSFMVPGSMPPGITFTRASTATYFNSTGTMQTAATDAPRWDYHPTTHALNGLLMEEARTNLLLNSATLGTQSVAVTAQAYTLSFYGTGTITKSGAATGALVGTGAFPQRVSQTFTPTAGTLTLTVTGSVLNAQLEAGAFPTSYIPTTAASVTRAGDFAVMPTTGWYSATVGSMAAYIITNAWPPSGTTYNAGVWTLDDGAGTRANSIDEFGFVNAGVNFAPQLNVFAASVNKGNPPGGNPVVAPSSVIGMGGAWGGTTITMAMNGALVSGALTGLPSGISRLSLGFGFGGVNFLNGWLRRVRYWPRVLTNAELQSVTI